LVGEKISRHLRIADMAQNNIAGRDALHEDVVAPKKVLRARRGALSGTDAEVGEVVGADQRRAIARRTNGAPDLTRESDDLGRLSGGDSFGLHGAVDEEARLLALVQNRSATVRKHDTDEVPVAPRRVGVRLKRRAGGLRQVDVRGDGAREAGRRQEASAAAGDAHEALTVDRGGGGTGDIVGLGRRAGHNAREAVQYEGDAGVQQLDVLEGADKLLNAHLERGELAWCRRRQHHIVGEPLERLPRGKPNVAAVEKLRQVAAHSLIDLLREGELDQPGCAVSPNRVALERRRLALIAYIAVSLREDGAELLAGGLVERLVFGEEEIVDHDEQTAGALGPWAQ